MKVYQIHARGLNWLTGEQKTTIHSLTVFKTHEAAESRMERFRQACIDREMLIEPEGEGCPIKVWVVELEVVDE